VIREITPPDSPGDNYDPQRLSTIFSEPHTHAPTVTRAPTVTDYQPNAFTPTYGHGEHGGYFDEGSVRAPSEINIHDHHHGGMTSPTVLGEPWDASPQHAHLPLHVPPSRNASVRQAPSAITRHGTVINDHGSIIHAPGVAASMGMGSSFRGSPSHVPLPDSSENHTLRTKSRSQRTHQSSGHHDAPIYVDAHHGGLEPIIVNAGAPASASGHGNNVYLLDAAGHQRRPSVARQPVRVFILFSLNRLNIW
jgi:hypothetical protein